jgi:hypothetical protein
MLEKPSKIVSAQADEGSFDCVRLSPHFAQDDRVETEIAGLRKIGVRR